MELIFKRSKDKKNIHYFYVNGDEETQHFSSRKLAEKAKKEKYLFWFTTSKKCCVCGH